MNSLKNYCKNNKLLRKKTVWVMKARVKINEPKFFDFTDNDEAFVCFSCLFCMNDGCSEIWRMFEHILF